MPYINHYNVLFFYRKGDFYRYLAEFTVGDEKREAAEKSEVAYETARDVTSKSFPATDPIRLGLALSYSVWYYEILNQPDKARSIAKQAFDDAIVELDTLSEDNYKDSTLIMQLLSDNLTLWSTDLQREGEKNFNY